MQNQTYYFCIDCGRAKKANTFRNCKSCMEKVKNDTIFRECQMCSKTKKGNKYGVCENFANIVEELNNRARWNR